MRYYTREWHQGELPDSQAEQAAEAYLNRLQEISPRLSPDMLLLATGIDLHDGIIEAVRWRPSSGELQLNLVVSALDGSGYQAVKVDYFDTKLGRERVNALRRAAESRYTEILYAEIDLAEDGTPTHRILFWPSEQVTLEFESVSVELSPRLDRRVDLLCPFVVEELDEDGSTWVVV